MKLQIITAYNLCYKCARDPISFPVDQEYELVNENDQKNWQLINWYKFYH